MLRIKAEGGDVETTQEFRGMSKLIEDALLDNCDEEAEVDITDINCKDVQLIVDFCTHHKFEK